MKQGLQVLICRPFTKANELAQQLSGLGIEAYAAPLINIEIGPHLAQLQSALLEMPDSSPVFLLSPNVFYYNLMLSTDRASAINQTFSQSQATYFAIGQSTALRFNECTKQRAIFPTGREISENLIENRELNALITNLPATDKQALIIRGNLGREVIKRYLVMQQFKVKEIEVYQRVPILFEDSVIPNYLNTSKTTLFVVTSGEILQILTNGLQINMQSDRVIQQRYKLVVVSERLVNQAKELGWKDIYLAANANNSALSDAVLKVYCDG